jgi:hypothetical protein
MKRLSLVLLATPSLALADTAVMSWNPNTDTDLVGYCVYVGSESNNYTHKTTVGNTTNAYVDLWPGTNYIAVTAKNSSGLESDFSNVQVIPVNPPPPPIVRASKCSDGIRLEWDSISGGLYRIATATELATPPRTNELGQFIPLSTSYWTEITGDMQANSPLMEWSEPFKWPLRFYRVIRIR